MIDDSLYDELAAAHDHIAEVTAERDALRTAMLAIKEQVDRAAGRGVVTMERALDEIADIVRVALDKSENFSK